MSAKSSRLAQIHKVTEAPEDARRQRGETGDPASPLVRVADPELRERSASHISIDNMLIVDVCSLRGAPLSKRRTEVSADVEHRSSSLSIDRAARRCARRWGGIGCVWGRVWKPLVEPG